MIHASKHPLVSVVTPTLNQGRFIEATIRSVKNQTYRPLEHIVVDGGSRDETIGVLRRHEGTYPMRWTSEPDFGMYDAVNKGFRLARGEIFAYLNSDDLYFPWTLEAVIDQFRRHPSANVVFGDVLGISDASGHQDIRFQPEFRYDFLLRSGSLVQPGVFWRRNVNETIGEFDPSFRLAGDLDFWLRIGADPRYVRIEELVAIERDHEHTKRASQWSLLMRESAIARARVDRARQVSKAIGRVFGRFRAWRAKRVLWMRFALQTRRQTEPGDPWARFLIASRTKLAWKRLIVGQLPWIGRRFISGSIDSQVDWLADRESALMHNASRR